MLVFIDESGDSGLRVVAGSSKYFVVSLVMFQDNDAASACDQRIQLLKRELGYDPSFTFHFTENSDRVRRAFLQAVAPQDFLYFGFVLNKDPAKLWGDWFRKSIHVTQADFRPELHILGATLSSRWKNYSWNASVSGFRIVSGNCPGRGFFRQSKKGWSRNAFVTFCLPLAGRYRKLSMYS